jgi:para-nitrobenzyl esterase
MGLMSSPTKKLSREAPMNRNKGAVAGAFASLLAIGLASMNATAQPAPTAPFVKTDAGPVEGARGDGVDVFLGIPFAAPPVGEHRLAPPVAPPGWTTPLRATVRPSACPQTASPDPAGLASNTEDCLYLNVWSPRPAGQPRPVIVWFHGGGFVEGYGAAKQYDGTHLAAQANAIVVTANYRVGALGFLAGAALDATDSRHVSGNYGLMDAQAAVGWVNRNIAAFGGDPHRITVMGESAGANMVLGLLASPASDGLFQRAIVESGTDGAHTVPLAQAEKQTYAHALEEIGCGGAADTAACLRAAPVQSFLQMSVKPTMVQDGLLLPLDPFAALQQGRFVHVPVLIGSNAKENYLFTARTESDVLKRHLTFDDVPGLLKTNFAAGANAVATHYSADAYVNAATLIGSALTDRRFSCMAELARKGLSQTVPVYGYQLDIADPVQQQPLAPGGDLPNLSYHTTDLGYVFDNDNDAQPLTGRHAALSRMMIAYWAAFAAAGDPNAATGESARPTWPRFSASDPAVLTLADAPSLTSAFAAEHKCAFWEQSGMVAGTWQ